MTPSNRAAAVLFAARIFALLALFLCALIVASVALDLHPAALPVVVGAYAWIMWVLVRPVMRG